MDTVKSIMEITEEKKYTADMSREIACNVHWHSMYKKIKRPYLFNE